MKAYLGIDIGSISTNLAVLDENKKVLATLYIRTKGDPIKAVQRGLKEIKEKLPKDIEIAGACTTGSARRLIAVMLKADITKNEIIAHAYGTLNFYPKVRTILEIGGQDSKIILLNKGIVTDFNMNTVCAAGTGSFIEHQAERLSIPIEEFGHHATKSTQDVNIAGRCTIFAESDMIHKAQLGFSKQDIIKGLCESIVKNYLNNVAQGKKIETPIVFQGGVAANIGVKQAFEKELGQKIIVPEYFNVMGAIGSAIIAQKEAKGKSSFIGFNIDKFKFETRSFTCDCCPNNCEIIETLKDGKVIDRYGGRCDRWDIID